MKEDSSRATGEDRRQHGPKTLGASLEKLAVLFGLDRELLLRGLEEERSQERQTKNSPGCTELTTIPEIDPGDPLAEMADQEMCCKALMYVGRALNCVPGPDAIRHMGQVMAIGQWSVSELRAAAVLIPNDKELAKECSYSGSVTPAVFAAAREREEVKTKRLLTWTEANRYSDTKRIRAVRLRGKTFFLAE